MREVGPGRMKSVAYSTIGCKLNQFETEQIREAVEASGYIQLRPSKHAMVHERHGYLGFIYVSAALRGRGIAGELMQRLMGWGEDQGVTDFYLDVYAANEPAIQAYRKLGFEPNTLEMRLNRSRED